MIEITEIARFVRCITALPSFDWLNPTSFLCDFHRRPTARDSARHASPPCAAAHHIVTHRLFSRQIIPHFRTLIAKIKRPPHEGTRAPRHSSRQHGSSAHKCSSHIVRSEKPTSSTPTFKPLTTRKWLKCLSIPNIWASCRCSRSVRSRRRPLRVPIVWVRVPCTCLPYADGTLTGP